VAGVTTILVVDDDPGIRFMLRVILEQEGYAVLEAGNGEAALAAIGSQVPDMVMTDLMMPVMSGAELIVRLRSEAGTAGIPIVVVSSNPEAIEGLGVNATVTKPFSAPELADRVREVAGRTRKGQQV